MSEQRKENEQLLKNEKDPEFLSIIKDDLTSIEDQLQVNQKRLENNYFSQKDNDSLFTFYNKYNKLTRLFLLKGASTKNATICHPPFLICAFSTSEEHCIIYSTRCQYLQESS